MSRQVIALQASENPAMMAVVSQLQHAIMTMPWPIRCAAAQATAKVRMWLCLLAYTGIALHVGDTTNAILTCERSGGCAIRRTVQDTLLQHFAIFSSL